MPAKGKFEEVAPQLLKYLSQGHSNKGACLKCGIEEHTIYDWMNRKPSFKEAVKRAKKDADSIGIERAKRSLLDLVTGFHYDETVTEFETRANPDFDPNVEGSERIITIMKKQKKKTCFVVPNVEAIKFYLTNKCPDVWKNRNENNINAGNLLKDMKITHVYAGASNDTEFPSSEAEVDGFTGE